MKPNLIRISAMLMAFGSLVFIPVAATAADTFEVDPVHSAVAFRIQHLGISYVQGRFNNVAWIPNAAIGSVNKNFRKGRRYRHIQRRKRPAPQKQRFF